MGKKDALSNPRRGGQKKDVSFDVSKFSVFGRKQSRSAVINRPDAENKRRAAVALAEKQSKNRNVFLDERFGEDDEEIGYEEKMLRRFQKERATRASKFDLGEESDDDLQLTHKGQSLGDMTEFDAGFGSDDDDEEFFSDKVVGEAHFGGGNADAGAADKDQPRTRQEIMQEVIAKSKKFRAERQRGKEEDELLVDSLDRDFADFSYLVQARSNEVAEANAAEEEERWQWSQAGAAASAKNEPKKANIDNGLEKIESDFDKAVRKLEMDNKKAAPTERMRSEEELALLEKQRLEKLEDERLRRMTGDLDDKEEEEEDGETPSERRRTDDDLDDGFEYDMTGNRNTRLQKVRFESDEEDEEEDDEEDEEADEDEADEDEDEADEEADEDEADEEADEDEEAAEPETKKLKSALKAASLSEPIETGSELPYTFQVPSDATQYTMLVSKLTEKEEVLVIKRMLACNSPKADPRNRPEMERFLEILVQRIGSAVETDTPRLVVANAVTRALFVASPLMPNVVAAVFQTQLRALNDGFSSSRQNGISDAGCCSWPSFGQLCILQAASSLFPVTDWRHPVVTPAILTLCRCLYHCKRVQATGATVSDVLTGCLATSVLYSLLAESRRFCPEPIDYLLSLLSGEGCLSLDKCPAKIKPKQMAFQQTVKDSAQTRVNLVGMAYGLLAEFTELYSPLEAAKEILTPLYSKLQSIKAASALSKHHGDLLDRVRAICDSTARRKPLQWQPKKLQQIQMFNPRFDENYNMDKTMDPVKERAEEKKMKKRLNREMKHTMRELQRDSQLLTEARELKQQRKMDARKAKMNKHKAELEGQQHNFLQRSGGQKRPNRKRKQHPQGRSE